MARSVLAFAGWTASGFLAGFGLLYLLTPVGPLFALVAWATLRYLPRICGRVYPEVLGAVAGFGAFWLFVATTVDEYAAAMAAFGCAAVAVAAASYLVAGRRRCGRDPAPG